MFSLSWYLVGGLVAFGVGILVGFEICDKIRENTIKHLKDLYNRNVNSLIEFIEKLKKEGK